LNSTDYSSYVNESFERTVTALLKSKNLTDLIVKAAMSIINSFNNGGKVLLIGNGGSASDASHMAGELIGRFRRERSPLPAIALTTDNSVITAIANDYGYDQVFARQCLGLLKPGDVLIAISTSGNSKNIIKAVLECKKLKQVVKIALTGFSGGMLTTLTDISIRVPSDNTATIQEVHRAIIHIICSIIDDHYVQK
jgi:D-sedoheptulose 7-phosphate isomerase